MSEGPANVVGVILAGGMSRRMGGGDKGLLPLGRTTLLGAVAARLAAQLPGGRGALVLNANDDPKRFDDTGLPVAPDTLSGRPGPLAGVLAGLDWAAERGADRIVTVACDTPFFPDDLTARLTAAAAAAAAPLACAATPDETGALRDHPTFGLWPTVLRDDLRRALESGMRKVVLWTERHGCARAAFARRAVGALTFDPFFNVNTPDDMQQARRLAQELGL